MSALHQHIAEHQYERRIAFTLIWIWCLHKESLTAMFWQFAWRVLLEAEKKVVSPSKSCERGMKPYYWYFNSPGDVDSASQDKSSRTSLYGRESFFFGRKKKLRSMLRKYLHKKTELLYSLGYEEQWTFETGSSNILHREKDLKLRREVAAAGTENERIQN
jgi:hypothetical protein